MRIFYKSVILLMFILFASCNDNSLMSELFYSGITETDEVGNLIGNFDQDDWRFPPASNSPLSPLTSYAMWPAYPNPTNRFFTFRYAIPEASSIVVWLDDKPENKKTTIVSKDCYAGVYSIKVDLLYGNNSLKRKEGIVRLFFSIPGNTNFKTIHGDILFKY